MKKIFISLLTTLLTTLFAYTQNNIFPASGSVGIGTNTPTSKLHVVGDIKAEGRTFSNQTFVYEANSINNQSPGIIGVLNDNFLYKGKYFNHYGLGFYRDEKGYFKAYFSDYFGIDFFTNGSHRMVIGGNGNIGIGTTNPDEKLTVNGTLHAKEVKVDLQIPADYVFQKYYTGVSSLKPEYHLPALQEIEKFTRENHHLPGIPSANEIQENGLKVGEMSNLLLQKVEELTLYTLEQEKKITEQNSTLQTQQNELEKLKGELNEIKKLLTPT